jgi:hypothetical protein
MRMSNIGRNAIPESPHLDMIITEELIARAKSLGACHEGVRAAQKLMGKPIRSLERDYADWSMRLYDGMSVTADGDRFWYLNGLLHRHDGPAAERADGGRYWYINGMCHRDDGPAVERADGTREWYVEGRLHREDGPAVEWADGTRDWYINGMCHRDDGPAVERADGTREWYLNGERHRHDGPAIEWANGYRLWYVKGRRVSESEFPRAVTAYLANLATT